MREKKRVLKPIYGIIALIVTVVALVFIGSWVQNAYGVYGLIITEIMLLLIAGVFIFLFKIPIKEVLPIHIPSVRDIGSIFVLWLASFFLVALINLNIVYFFPELEEVAGVIRNFATNNNFLTVLFAMVLLPSICEEALHRGFILKTFENVKREWLIIVSMGVLFGFFHLDIYRFAGTAILGMTITYIMVKKHNILLPMIFHFVNNLVSVIFAFISQDVVTTDIDNVLNYQILGGYFIFTCFVPFLFLLGSRMLSKQKDEKDDESYKNKVWICFGFAVCMIAFGVFLMLINA